MDTQTFMIVKTAVAFQIDELEKLAKAEKKKEPGWWKRGKMRKLKDYSDRRLPPGYSRSMIGGGLGVGTLGALLGSLGGLGRSGTGKGAVLGALLGAGGGGALGAGAGAAVNALERRNSRKARRDLKGLLSEYKMPKSWRAPGKVSRD
jgi:hypothetical protein